jgi:hypothetical protein
MPADDATATATALADLELLRRFEPVLRFTAGELFFPAAVDEYVANCELFERGPNGERQLVVPRGELHLDRLVEIGLGHPRPGQYLRFVGEPFTRAHVARWRLRADRPKFHGASRLARVGVMSRVVDALNRASLLFRGKVASGTEAAAETQYRERMRSDHHPYYGRVVRSGGYTVLQYWFFYVFNDWRSRIYGVNDHEADWEQVTVYLAGDELQPSWVVFSAHDEVGDDLRRRWDDPDLTLVGEHPVVHPGLGSHSGAYLAGEYLTTYEGEAFQRLLRVFRGLSRAFLPWTRDRVHAGVGIPYIDYSRGDGVGIGPGEERSWTPVLVDDQTPWVLHYRGLWGNDTEDPLGGERGPAGPRYERSGVVRSSWGDPVGWSGLRKVAPTPEAAEAALRVRLDELEVEIDAMQQRIEREQTALRAVVSGGERVPPAVEAALVALTAQQVSLRDERTVLQHRLGTPPELGAPHDHLRHRRLPLPPEDKARRRVLALWSAISTSLVLMAVALMFLPVGFSVVGIGVVALLLVFTFEALARKQLVRFLATVAVLVVAASLVLAIVGLAFIDLRLGIAAPLVTAAVAMLFLNLRELLRD